MLLYAVIYTLIFSGFLALAAADFAMLAAMAAASASSTAAAHRQGRGIKSRAASLWLGSLGYILITIVFVLLLVWPAQAASTPAGFRLAAGLTLVSVSAALLVWSVCIEIPWTRRRLKLKDGALVTSGTYASCRHPGWWWFALCIAGILIVKADARIVGPSTAMILANTALIIFQDRYSFPRIFAEYTVYSVSVPFLAPWGRREMSHSKKGKRHGYGNCKKNPDCQ